MLRFDLPDDPDALDRFVLAQEGSYQGALSELKQGRKQGHWMWFIFPQLRGLGRSQMSYHYGIADLDEARRYLAHPVLGPRLVAAAEAVLSHRDQPAEAILGGIDADKLRSSATLFAAVDRQGGVFERLLDAFFQGRACRLTRDRIR
nr:DUF1810 domain-containing protein [Paracoccus saliphilus]